MTQIKCLEAALSLLESIDDDKMSFVDSANLYSAICNIKEILNQPVGVTPKSEREEVLKRLQLI